MWQHINPFKHPNPPHPVQYYPQASHTNRKINHQNTLTVTKFMSQSTSCDSWLNKIFSCKKRIDEMRDTLYHNKCPSYLYKMLQAEML